MEQLQINLNHIWILVAGILVFFMQAGFMALESGLVRSKNSINVAVKNFMDFTISSLAFWLIGFTIMFGATQGGWFGWGGIGIPETPDKWNYTFWFFQVVFAGTAATIVSGAIAERTKFGVYLFISLAISVLIYPVFGHWTWGNLFNGGQEVFLASKGFIDFAGSSVVHSVGGWVGLAGAIVVGPRLGKYVKGKVNAIPANNLGIATLGVFILWLGWFGFNGGSTTTGTADIGIIIVNTNLAAATGGLTALFGIWIIRKKPIVEYALNGVLGGLVSITANCNGVSPESAIIIGAIGGILVNLSVYFFDKILKVDDPVGAISVHGVCGLWGTLAVALFVPLKDLKANMASIPDWTRLDQLGVQGYGALIAFLWAFGVGLVLFWVLKKTVGLRPSPEDEKTGLNFTEHEARNTLGDTAKAMSEIAEAKGDLTQRIDAEAGDETGEIGILFNSLLDWLHDTILQFKDFSGQISHISSDLVDGVKLVENTIYKTMDSMGKVDESTTTHETIIQTTKQRLEHIVSIVTQVVGDTQDQSAHIIEASAAIEEMVASFSHLTDMATEAFDISRNLLSVAKTGGEDIRLQIRSIQDIEASSHEVVEIVGLIDSISTKTNLLAMNAAIEASHAGESGKGFAVVASEIRKLAVNTATSVKAISDIVGSMIEKVNRAVETGGKAENALNEILNDAQKVSEINTQIADGTREQLSISKEVLIAVDHLNRITAAIQESMDQEKMESVEIGSTIRELVDVAHQIKKRVDDQVTYTKKVLDYILDIEKNAEAGDSMAVQLGNLINQFKLSKGLNEAY